MLKVSDLHSYTLHGPTQLPLLKPVSFNCTIGTSPKFIERQVLASLALCVHLDTTPVNIKISGEQVSFCIFTRNIKKASQPPDRCSTPLSLLPIQPSHYSILFSSPLANLTSFSRFRSAYSSILSSLLLTSVLSFLPAVQPAAPLTSSIKPFAD